MKCFFNRPKFGKKKIFKERNIRILYRKAKDKGGYMSYLGLFLTICSADKCQHLLAFPRCVCKYALSVCSFITVGANDVIESFMACFLEEILYIEII